MDDRTSISGSDGPILAILSVTNSRIDQMQIMLMTYFDGQITEIRTEFEVKLYDFPSSLSMIQHEIEVVKTGLKAVSSHS